MKEAAKSLDYKFIYKPSEKDEILSFIKEILEMEWDRYREAFKQNRTARGIKIMKFFQMERSPLHAKFRNEIIDRQREEAGAIEGLRLENLIKRNLIEARQDERTRDNDSIDLKYYKIRTFDLVTNNSIVQIGIPYMKRTDKNRTDLKFAFQLLINKNAAPKLFEKICDNYPQYS